MKYNATIATTFSPLNPDNVTAGNNLLRCQPVLAETIVEYVITVAIIFSNLACMRLKIKPRDHPENWYYIFNLAVANTLCGAALFVTISIKLKDNEHDVNDYESLACKVWAPIHIYCVTLPFVVLATLGMDVAYYCHHSIHYRRRMSKHKLWITIASGWVYTLIVVVVTTVTAPKVVCNKYLVPSSNHELKIPVIVFPVLLMLLPALMVVCLFIYVMSRYWQTSRRLAKGMKLSNFGRNQETKTRIIAKFVMKFFHLIVFSIICSLTYSVLTIVEAVVETENHIRICALYHIDRVAILLNSLLSPWIYCLATKQVRHRIKRRMKAWWLNKPFLPCSTRRGSISQGKRTTCSCSHSQVNALGDLSPHGPNPSEQLMSQGELETCLPRIHVVKDETGGFKTHHETSF
ncbi:uncharacterized protein LOC143445644 [Clavelina lepadiformis]|uniref:uncharacterized protein LOC143445644 n=1 Tax=Clavelina lepadiformis TaxID=159417 RepID=UPI0040415946